MGTKNSSKSRSFEPLFNQVLVKLMVEPEMTAGGIIIPEKARQKPDEGEIVEVGNDVKELKVGDHVIFGKYVGTVLTVDFLEGEYLLLHETDVLGRILG